MVKSFVECTQEYWEFVRNLRMDTRVVSGFIDIVDISTDMQVSYMTKNAHNYRIALADGKPAGYIGVIDNDIRICTHPDYQHKGIARFMLEEMIKIYPNAYGKVKIDNEASKNLFRSLGFTETFLIFTK